MNKTITKKLFPLVLGSFLVAIGLGNWMPIHAEEPNFSFSPIAIPFDSSTDGSAFFRALAKPLKSLTTPIGRLLATTIAFS